jgi:hypothetical protein
LPPKVSPLVTPSARARCEPSRHKSSQGSSQSTRLGVETCKIDLDSPVRIACGARSTPEQRIGET